MPEDRQTPRPARNRNGCNHIFNSKLPMSAKPAGEIYFFLLWRKI